MAKTNKPRSQSVGLTYSKDLLEEAMEAAGRKLIGEDDGLTFKNGDKLQKFDDWKAVEHWLTKGVIFDEFTTDKINEIFAKKNAPDRMKQLELRQRQESADKRMRQNRKVKSLTGEQHDALAYLCRVRHEMHAGQDAFFLTDDPRYAAFELLLGRDGNGELNRMLKDAGLPTIDIDTDIFRAETDKCFKREDFDTDHDYEMARAQAFDASNRLAEKINFEIEEYLRGVDKKHGTDYCPTGEFRHDHESHAHRAQRKYDKMMGQKPRLFVDQDGTLAKFNNNISSPEELYVQGYFENLEPQQRVVDAVKDIIRSGKVDVYLLSAVLPDSKYALPEKNSWADRIIPEIPPEKRIFVPCGEDKAAYVPGGIRATDVLLDDYTVNLNAWEPPAIGIKLLNDINSTKGTWQGQKISFNRDPKEIADLIIKVAEGRKKVHDPGREVGQTKAVQKFSEQLKEAAKGVDEVVVHMKGQEVTLKANDLITAVHGARSENDKMPLKAENPDDPMKRTKTAAASVSEIEMITDKDNHVLYESEDHKIMRLVTFGYDQFQGNGQDPGQDI